MTPFPVTVRGLGLGLPAGVVTNDDLAKTLDTNDEWISARTGIRSRRVLEDDKALSHIAILAGKEALEESGVDPNDIHLTIVATVTPDTFMPATACRVAAALGCHQSGALDLNIACSGFLYAFITACAQIKSGLAQNVLVIGGDTLSRITNWEDRRTAVLFGDGAGAAVLSAGGPGELLGYDYGAKGHLSEALQITAGPRRPSDNPTDYKTQMDGRAVFRFATAAMVDSSRRSLAMAQLPLDKVDLVVPHQANLRIIESAAKKWGLPMEKVCVNLDKYGNVSAGSIPIALAEAKKEGRIKPGHHILLAGFGGGLSWGSVVLKWGNLC